MNKEELSKMFTAMNARLKEKEPKYDDSWKTKSLDDLRDKVMFMYGKWLGENKPETKWLLDLANQAMLLYLRLIDEY